MLLQHILHEAGQVVDPTVAMLTRGAASHGSGTDTARERCRERALRAHSREWALGQRCRERVRLGGVALVAQSGHCPEEGVFL